MIREIPAKGIKGFLLYSPFAKKHFFRVYDPENKKKFVDYDIRCEEVEIEILTNWNSLYIDTESDTNNFLEWSSIARGRNTKDEIVKEYTCAPILVPVSTGLISGAASVIGAYIFRPIWNRIKSLWESKQEEKTECQIK